MGKVVRVVAVALLVALQALVGIPGFMTDGAYWQRALLYSFFHGSWWHLAVNCIAVWGIYSRGCKPWRDLLFPYVIAVLVYPLSVRPVIGYSNVLYAVLGLRTPPLSSAWWKQPSVAVFFAVTFALLLVPRFSATTHIAAFALGMAGAALHRFIKEIDKDARRYY